MDATITTLRKELDTLDLQLLKLLEQRIAVSVTIQERKSLQGLSQTDSLREEQILSTLSKESTLSTAAIETLFKTLIKVSKQEFTTRNYSGETLCPK